MSFVLLLTTTGITITEHYCGSRLVSVNLFSEPDKCCDNSDCCHNETIIVKLDTDLINITSDNIDVLVYITVLLVPNTICNDNSILSRQLALNFFEYSDLPPPAISTFLSKLGTFLL